MKKRVIFEIILLMIFSIVLGKIFPAIPCKNEIIDYQFNMFTASSVFAGFSFTTLGILLGMSSENVMRRLQNTTVITNKSKKIVMSLLFFCLSSLNSLAFIIGIVSFMKMSVQKIIYYFGILALIMGIFYFVYSVYEIYDLMKKVYGVNAKELQKKKTAFEMELKKPRGNSSAPKETNEW